MHLREMCWVFLGGPVVKYPPSSAEDTGSILIKELRSFMPVGAFWPMDRK